MKGIVFLASIISYCYSVLGQNASGDVNVNLSLANVISIAFVSTGSATGGLVSLSFSSVNSFNNGVISSSQQIKVQSNKTFNISVAANSDYFTYSGTASPAPQVPLAGVLTLQASSNNTGGSINAPFRNNYGNIGTTAQSLILDGTQGSNKTFKVRYKATPGFNYPQGTYTANIIYTATQT